MRGAVDREGGEPDVQVAHLRVAQALALPRLALGLVYAPQTGELPGVAGEFRDDLGDAGSCP
ncbi:hypothetical protein AQI84_00235 [Streptomyces griseorubiginosus]|nr:hypothetical protein AQI84_00235 [Streptomyces griseorubiginosus]